MKQNYLKRFACIGIVFLLLILTPTGCGVPQTQSPSTESVTEHAPISQSEVYLFVLNKRSKKIHKTTCGTGALIAAENRRVYKGTMDTLLDQGYTVCGNCFDE